MVRHLVKIVSVPYYCFETDAFADTLYFVYVLYNPVSITPRCCVYYLHYISWYYVVGYMNPHQQQYRLRIIVHLYRLWKLIYHLCKV